jgi:hypothetical protein
MSFSRQITPVKRRADINSQTMITTGFFKAFCLSTSSVRFDICRMASLLKANPAAKPSIAPTM